MLGLLIAPATADVIYLTDGSVLVVDKAWREGDQVRYQTSAGVKSLPGRSVKQLRQQDPGSPQPPSGQRYGIAVESGSEPAPVELVPTWSPGQSADSKDITDETVRRLRENLKAQPNDLRSKRELVQALNSLGSLQYLKGDLQAARTTLQQALGLEKKEPILLTNAALVEYRLGNYRVAEDLLITAVQLDPKNQEARYLLGEAFYAEENLPMAINAWKEALQLGPMPVAASRLQKAKQESGVHSELGVLQSAHFILRYDRQVSDYRLGQEILYALEQDYRRLSSELTSEPPATLAVILYPDQTYFDITQAPRWSGGLYDGKIRLPIKGLVSVTPELNAILRHELTHSFIKSLSRQDCPAWFNEGLAQLEEGKSAAGQRRLLAQLRGQDRLVPLAQLGTSFVGFPSERVGVAYLQGLSAVEFLAGRNGRGALRDLLDLLRQNSNFESAWRSVTRQSLTDFEKEWLASLNP